MFVLDTAKENATEIYCQDVTISRGAEDVTSANIDEAYVAAQSGSYNPDGTLNTTGTVVETDLTDATTDRDFYVSLFLLPCCDSGKIFLKNDEKTMI